MEKDTQCKWKPKDSIGSCILTKQGFKPKILTKDKECHCIMLKESVHQQEIIIYIYIYHPTPEHLIYIKQILTDPKGKVGSNIIIVKDFKISLSTIDISSREKINKGTLDLNHTLCQIDLSQIHRRFHPIAAENIFYSSAQGTFSKIGHMIGHKTSHGKFKNTEIILSIFSSCMGIKLEIIE